MSLLHEGATTAVRPATEGRAGLWTGVSVVAGAAAAGASAVLPLAQVGTALLALLSLALLTAAAVRTSWHLAATLAVLVATATGALFLLPAWSAYLLAVLLLATRPRGPRAPVHWLDLVVGALLLYGFAGSLLGRVALDQQANALAFFAPALVALLHLVRGIEMTRAAVRLLRITITGAGFAYLAVSNLILWAQPPIDTGPWLHTRTYWAAVALAGAFLLRRWVLLAVGAGLVVTHFLFYPGLTYALVLLATASVVVLCRARWGPPVLFLVAATAAATVTVLGLTQGDAREAYFSAVGKTDNTPARDALREIGEEKLAESPWFGSAFTADISVPAPAHIVGVDRVPLHDDYLQFGVGGGVLAIAALVVWAVGLTAVGVLVSRRAYASGRTAEGDLALLLVAAHVGLFLTAAFNPVLIIPSTALLTGLVFDLVMTLHLAVARPPAGPVSEASPADV